MSISYAKHAFLIAALAVMVASCEEPDPEPPAESAELSELLTTSSSHLLQVGDSAADEPGAVLLDVIDARFTKSGDRIVVLNNFPPFIQVFDRTGGTAAAFVQEGGGPGEARNPYGIAVSGDTSIMMLDQSSLSLFDIGGEFLGKVTDLDFHPVRAASGCNGHWIIYGPSRAAPASASNVWLRTLRFDASGEPTYTDLYSDPSVPERIAFGAAGGLWADQSDVLFFHRDGSPPALVKSSCGGDESERSSEILMTLPTEQDDPMRQVDGGNVQFGGTVDGGKLFPRGVTGLEDGSSLWVMLGIRGIRFTRETYFGAIGASDEHAVKVRGSYTLHDRTEDGRLLFGTDDPYPFVFVVAESEVIEALQN